MSYATVVAAINTILSGATDVGDKIYNYDRLEMDEASFKAAFNDSTVNYIKAWTITRDAIASEPEASYNNQVTTNWTIRGYIAFKAGASNREATVQGIIDNIRIAFRGEPRLNNTVLTVSPLQVSIIEPRVFSGVLVHYIEMNLETLEQESWT